MNKILEIKFGSHLYGTNTENSDLDLKAIYLPTAREILLGNYKKTISTQRPKAEGERNNSDDVDIEVLSLDRFITLLLEGQTMALDILFAPYSNYTSYTEQGLDIRTHIYLHRHKFLNKNLNAFVGYAKQQAAKYGQKGFRIHALKSTIEFLNDHKSPTLEAYGSSYVQKWIDTNKNEHVSIVELEGPNNTKMKHLLVSGKYYSFRESIRGIIEKLDKRYEEYGARAILAEKNEGIDWKALSHAVRVNSEAYELLTTTEITFPRPDRELLLKIKLGQMPYKEVAEIIEDGLVKLEEAAKTSSLPDKVDKEFADDFIAKIYGEIVRNEK